ncbi:O-antigen ligase family protein [Aliiruegeria lutimaris]|uniref:O-antigen ligase like membrane protein n=1 Tax=Aliiruegeria lutimaris TaxID=571298 RepID=A0A1G9PX54_9RHOB|nr:O-antigen ligase family protein [Aliiruegeria lutimaris]SDM02685.1 hypothetical protein SAMN04488026_11493 [Aliiruegeria lutimaris]
MTVFPASAVFFLIWLVLSFRDADRGIPMTIAVLPFGMFAGAVVGGLSILLAQALAMLTIGVLMLRWVSLGAVQANESGGMLPVLPRAALWLAIFALYALFSSLILVRLFQGRFMVFPMSVTFSGTPVSRYFPSTMTPLYPSNSNFAQAGYILLSSGFFLATVLVVRRRGLAFVERGMVWAAGINLALGALDFAALDGLLSLIRTADYSLANKHTVSGLPRIIGGFAEASSFGSVSAGFFGYFMISYLIGRRTRDGALAWLSFSATVMSLSSTGLAALGVALMLVALHARSYLRPGISRVFAHVLVILVAVLAIVISLTMVLTPALEMISKVLDKLVFSKGTTLSGMERGAWAQAGFDAFVETWGLGAGVGSLRSNGLTAVLLGTVGVPGTLAFLGFVWQAVGRPSQSEDFEVRRVFTAARIGTLTILASMLVSGTTPDPTLLIATFAALAVAAQEIGERAARSGSDPLDEGQRLAVNDS